MHLDSFLLILFTGSAQTFSPDLNPSEHTHYRLPDQSNLGILFYFFSTLAENPESFIYLLGLFHFV